jgi:peptide/nickel transport system permease protein
MTDAAALPATPATPARSGSFLALFARNRLATFGAAVLASVALLALLAPLLPLADPYAQNTANRFLRPLAEGHLLGTDNLGRDLLSRLIWGTRLSLAVGAAAAVAAALAGSAIGLMAGYFGGRVDQVLMRGIDMAMALPYILLALAIVAALGPGLVNALIAVAIVNVPFFARNIRGVTVTLANREFVDAARLAGLSDARIILSEILPNVLPVIVIAMSTTIGWMILETAGLSFLGLGAQPPVPDLGSMLGEARGALIAHPHVAVIPGLMIFVIVMGVNLVGDGVRDALDPRLRSGALSRPLPATMVDRRPPRPGHHGDTLVSVERLSVEFRVGGRTLRAVDDVSFLVRPGECLGLIGESGSGKSVTALALTGLVASPPGVIAGGAVRFGDRDLVGLRPSELRRVRGAEIAYVFQDPLSTLHPLMRVGDQLAEAILVHRAMSRAEAAARAVDLLGQVRIPDPAARARQYPHELSGGMRQRVGIAMALANEPKLLIADEPTTALDVTVQAQILKLLDDLRRGRGLAILFITHDFGVVGQLCDRVAVMYAGRIVEEGPTARVLDDPAHPYTRRLIACVPELGAGRRRLDAIPGLPPAADSLPQGCAFAPRCDRVTAACREGEIALRDVGPERSARCLFPEAGR